MVVVVVCVWWRGGGGVCDKTDTICALNMTSRYIDILFPSQTSMPSLPPISQPESYLVLELAWLTR